LDFSIPINQSRTGAGLPSSGAQAQNFSNINNIEMGKMNDRAPIQNENVDFTNFWRHANHPCVVIFTLIFKAGAIVSFLFLNLFLNNDALTFIVVVIFSAFDFWFVKNVSGRY
jgi:hypothetical protein